METATEQKSDRLDVEAGQIPWETKYGSSRPTRRWPAPAMPKLSKRHWPAMPALPDRMLGMRKKIYLIVFGAIVLVLILAIGLGAGLGSKHRSVILNSSSQAGVQPLIVNVTAPRRTCLFPETLKSTLATSRTIVPDWVRAA